MKRILTPVIFLSLLAQTGVADQQQRPPKPPKEAVEACANKASGDACAFEGSRGTIEGVCWAPKEDLPLACKPSKRGRN